jgi:hypothetical protein
MQVNDIVSIKLVSGDEIIGRLEEKDANIVKLSKPVQIVASQQGMGFAPVCISIDDASVFTFQQAHIIFLAPTRKELVDAYIRATTGIQLATSLK